jgi:hypothetical protein
MHEPALPHSPGQPTSPDAPPPDGRSLADIERDIADRVLLLCRLGKDKGCAKGRRAGWYVSDEIDAGAEPIQLVDRIDTVVMLALLDDINVGDDRGREPLVSMLRTRARLRGIQLDDADE